MMTADVPKVFLSMYAAKVPSTRVHVIVILLFFGEFVFLSIQKNFLK